MVSTSIAIPGACANPGLFTAHLAAGCTVSCSGAMSFPSTVTKPRPSPSPAQMAGGWLLAQYSCPVNQSTEMLFTSLASVETEQF